jgi:uncharacterized membrane protein YozB (DUF420 family)
MPEHDQLPSPRPITLRRFWRIFRLLASLSLTIAALAMIFVSRGDRELHIHMVIATGTGIFFMVLLGTSLMTLSFLSSSSGHDEQASAHTFQEDKHK